MHTWKAAAFIQYIDDNFNQAKREKQSRLSVEWGTWSRAMNLVLRDRIKTGTDPEELRLKYVIFYWTIMSQILEFHHKQSIVHHGKIRRRRKEADNIREMVLTGKGLTEFEADDPEFIKKMMG